MSIGSQAPSIVSHPREMRYGHLTASDVAWIHYPCVQLEIIHNVLYKLNGMEGRAYTYSCSAFDLTVEHNAFLMLMLGCRNFKCESISNISKAE